MINLDKRILDCEGKPALLSHKGTREMEALKQNPKLEFPETVKTVIKAALRTVPATKDTWLKEGKIEHGLSRMYGETEVKDDYFTKEELEHIRLKLIEYVLTVDDGKESGYFPPHIVYQVLEELKLLK